MTTCIIVSSRHKQRFTIKNIIFKKEVSGKFLHRIECQKHFLINILLVSSPGLHLKNSKTCFSMLYTLVKAWPFSQSEQTKIQSFRYSVVYTWSKQWIVFFTCSDWLHKVEIVHVCAIHLLAFLWILRMSFPSFLRKKELFRTNYLPECR